MGAADMPRYLMEIKYGAEEAPRRLPYWGKEDQNVRFRLRSSVLPHRERTASVSHSPGRE